MSDIDDQAEQRLAERMETEYEIREELRRNNRTIRGNEFDEVISELRGKVERLKKQVKELETVKP